MARHVGRCPHVVVRCVRSGSWWRRIKQRKKQRKKWRWDCLSIVFDRDETWVICMPRAKVCGRHRNKAVWDVIAKPTFFVCKAQLERHIFFVLVHRNFSVISGLKPLTPADDIFACKKFFTSPALFLSGSAGLGKKVTRPLSPTSRSNDFFFLDQRWCTPYLLPAK
jgi:hypothetical protein